MRIGIISKLWERSDPKSTGGTGVMVGNLVEGLIKRGHDVTLFATKDTKTRAKLISVLPKPFSKKRPYSEIYEYLNIAKAFQMASRFDIINCHVEHKSLFFANITKTPLVHTIGYGELFKLKDEINLLKLYKKESFIAVSQSINKKFKFLNFEGTVPVGLDYNNFPFNDSPDDYFLFLARMSPQKGVHLAVKAAKSTGIKLILAGKISSTDKKYLDQQVFPSIDGKKIIYVGEAKFNKKISLLKNARALIHPHTCFEAFGISMLEAQACGTPVIAYPYGATAEIVKNKETGFIVNNFPALIKAISKIDEIKRLACRQRAEKLFSLEQMVSGYENIYKNIIKKHEKK